MITTLNPYTGKELKSYQNATDHEIESAISLAETTFHHWKKTTFEERRHHILNVKKQLEKDKREYAEMMTAEMGKPISQAIAEVEKCAWLCQYYADHAVEHLERLVIETDAQESFVTFEPLGIILAVMPWNYPFWQVFRFIIPSLMAGNVGLLKHSTSVMGSAQLIERVFLDAGLQKGCFQNLVIASDAVEPIINDSRIKAVTLTGSKPAGSAVASAAAKKIKKSVLELGGSNALVVLPDADMENTLETCVKARYQNTGQSCIAGKRLLLHEDIADQFLERFVEKVKELTTGDPMDENTYIGVMAREDLAKDLQEQVNDTLDAGAKLMLGGKRDGAYFEPTIVTNVHADMRMFKEETFGPAMAVTTFKTFDEAVDLVNQSDFGLGVSVFTTNIDQIKPHISRFEDGAVFINELVKSDPRLPFGGTKISGYGRELSVFGIREFVNIKTVYIN
ncbi:NAD-dependent succinate-semialdehyde dehydrogenase [Gangjinia marincola]|uniref:NAD-dependent succinate-semialdehyde dehydrogenase n=1 Tax=Gangjinia marincola TaxID=578463 RepID=A0ABP3XVD5_9FLAO